MPFHTIKWEMFYFLKMARIFPKESYGAETDQRNYP